MSATRRFSSQIRSYLAAHPYTIAGVQHRIAEWGRPIFTESTVQSTALHLRKEADELVEVAATLMGMCDSTMTQAEARAALADELADVLHLVFHCANVADIDLTSAFERKFERNQRRTWHPPDGDGIVFHDKEG